VGLWIRLLKWKPHNLHASSDIIQVIKSRRVRWACSTHGRDECTQNVGGETWR